MSSRSPPSSPARERPRTTSGDPSSESTSTAALKSRLSMLPTIPPPSTPRPLLPALRPNTASLPTAPAIRIPRNIMPARTSNKTPFHTMASSSLPMSALANGPGSMGGSTSPPGSTSALLSNSMPTMPPSGLPPITSQNLKRPRGMRDTTAWFYEKSYGPQPNAGGLHFSNLEEANTACDYIVWQGPTNDITIPHTDFDCQAYVRQLVEAIKKTDEAKDDKTGSYVSRFSDGYYPDWVIEACAWMVFGKALKIHCEGFSGPIFDPQTLDYCERSKMMTFQERIAKICDFLKITKNGTVTLMKGEKILTLVGSPQRLYESALSNAVSNAKRNKWVKAGRKADLEYMEGPTAKRKRTNSVNTTMPNADHTPSSPFPVSSSDHTPDPDPLRHRHQNHGPVGVQAPADVQMIDTMHTKLADIEEGVTKRDDDEMKGVDPNNAESAQKEPYKVKGGDTVDGNGAMEVNINGSPRNRPLIDRDGFHDLRTLFSNDFGTTTQENKKYATSDMMEDVKHTDTNSKSGDKPERKEYETNMLEAIDTRVSRSTEMCLQEPDDSTISTANSGLDPGSNRVSTNRLGINNFSVGVVQPALDVDAITTETDVTRTTQDGTPSAFADERVPNKPHSTDDRDAASALLTLCQSQR